MSTVTYEIVEHDGGWAYRVDGTYSETFSSHEAATRAAHAAAGEQRAPGDDDVGISYEDAKGVWHGEVSSSDDRPATEVED